MCATWLQVVANVIGGVWSARGCERHVACDVVVCAFVVWEVRGRLISFTVPASTSKGMLCKLGLQGDSYVELLCWERDARALP